MFTELEREMLTLSYFRVVSDSESLFEIQSTNTGHFWGVLPLEKKNRSEIEFMLLHKYHVDDTYHYQSTFAGPSAMLDLILEIIGHDDYRLKHKNDVFEEVYRHYSPLVAAQPLPPMKEFGPKSKKKAGFPEIDTDRAISVLNDRKKAMQKYVWIMDTVNTVNISKSAQFQRVFVGFYRVRRNGPWRNAYFQLFEDYKSRKHVDFDTIIDDLYARCGRVEASFSSKLLATLRPSMPIWDAHVLEFFGLKHTGNTCEERLLSAKGLYTKLAHFYALYSEKEEQPEIAAFDLAFPEFAGISPTKKLDFLIWAMIPEKKASQDT